MSDLTVARRYAQALIEEAERRGVTEAIDDDMDMLQQSLDASDDLARFFDSPVIPPEKKKQVIDALLEERVEELTRRFLHLLVDKDRETIVARMIEAYQARRDEQRNIVEVHVRAAEALSDDDRDALVTTLEAMTGQTVRLRAEEAPELLGGLVVRIGDTVYDGSVRNKLADLRERLRAGGPTAEIVGGDGHAPGAAGPTPRTP
jgi:F-type H+-transporting ATPase subunit delta